MTLEQFEIEVKSSLTKFILDYHEQHKKNPDHYPLSFPESNEGLWWEFFIEFKE